MKTNDQRICVLCARPIEDNEAWVTIPRNQPVHRKCYEKALIDSDDTD